MAHNMAKNAVERTSEALLAKVFPDLGEVAGEAARAVNARAGVGHESRLGDFSQVSPGATLSGHTTLGSHAFVATNASTVPGVTIGARAKVAAGTPVYRDLADDAVLSPFGVLKG